MPGFLDNERFRKLLFSYPGKAIQFLYEYYYQDLIRISTRLTHDIKVSEDILQETFFHVWMNHEWLGKEHGKSIRRYLVKVVQYKSISFYKKERKSWESRSKYARETANGRNEPSEEDRLIADEALNHIRKLMAKFPRREQECLRFSREDEMTNKQIAEHLKISEKAVERSITSAKKRLKMHWISLNRK